MGKDFFKNPQNIVVSYYNSNDQYHLRLLTSRKIERPIMSMMQSNCRTPIHEDLQRRLFKKKTMPEFWQKHRFSGLGQANFPGFRNISGMAMAWIENNGIK